MAHLAQPIRTYVITSTATETYWTAEAPGVVTVFDWHADVARAPYASVTTNASWEWAVRLQWENES